MDRLPVGHPRPASILPVCLLTHTPPRRWQRCFLRTLQECHHCLRKASQHTREPLSKSCAFGKRLCLKRLRRFFESDASPSKGPKPSRATKLWQRSPISGGESNGHSSGSACPTCRARNAAPHDRDRRWFKFVRVGHKSATLKLDVAARRMAPPAASAGNRLGLPTGASATPHRWPAKPSTCSVHHREVMSAMRASPGAWPFPSPVTCKSVGT
jgi:hypothetical protein